MDEERKRILGMLSEGSISVEECEELLKALTERRTEKVTREVKAVETERPTWPYVLLIVLAVVGVVMWLGISSLFGGSLLRRFHFGSPFLFPLFAVGGLMRMAALALWIWMLVDCIARMPHDFRLLFTSKHEYDKWIWLGVIVVANWVGALVYLIVIRQYSRGRVAGVVPQAKTAEAPPPEPFTPSRRARSVIPFFLIGLILVGLSALVLRPPTPALHVGILIVWLAIFWLWMLIDCLARDPREFGTLITSDKSVDKIVWLLLILFTSVIGAFAYHIAVRRRPRAPTAA